MQRFLWSESSIRLELPYFYQWSATFLKSQSWAQEVLSERRGSRVTQKFCFLPLRSGTNQITVTQSFSPNMSHILSEHFVYFQTDFQIFLHWSVCANMLLSVLNIKQIQTVKATQQSKWVKIRFRREEAFDNTQQVIGAAEDMRALLYAQRHRCKHQINQSRICFFKPLPLSCSASCQTVYCPVIVEGRCGDGGVWDADNSWLFPSAVEDVLKLLVYYYYFIFFTDTAQIVYSCLPPPTTSPCSEWVHNTVWLV